MYLSDTKCYLKNRILVAQMKVFLILFLILLLKMYFIYVNLKKIIVKCETRKLQRLPFN